MGICVLVTLWNPPVFKPQCLVYMVDEDLNSGPLAFKAEPYAPNHLFGSNLKFLKNNSEDLQFFKNPSNARQ